MRLPQLTHAEIPALRAVPQYKPCHTSVSRAHPGEDIVHPLVEWRGLETVRTLRYMLHAFLQRASTFRRTTMSRLNTWLLLGSNAYDEYTYVPWLGKNVYRRTVDLRHVTLL
jgi:hypothetical protein